MKFKTVLIGPHNDDVKAAFSSPSFAEQFLTEIIGDVFGVTDAIDRPAEFYMQEPDYAHNPKGHLGIEVRLTGVSRDGRTPKIFHDGLRAIKKLVADTASAHRHQEETIQIFAIIMLDDQIEVSPNTGVYSSVIESKPAWLNIMEN